MKQMGRIVIRRRESDCEDPHGGQYQEYGAEERKLSEMAAFEPMGNNFGQYDDENRIDNERDLDPSFRKVRDRRFENFDHRKEDQGIDDHLTESHFEGASSSNRRSRNVLTTPSASAMRIVKNQQAQDEFDSLHPEIREIGLEEATRPARSRRELEPNVGDKSLIEDHSKFVD